MEGNEIMKEFYTSDCHFGHENIIKYCNRPFKNIDHMNNEIIRRWNERVKTEDIVYHIGDFCFKVQKINGKHLTYLDYSDRLNGNIIFIKGNHDKNNKIKTKIHRLVIKIDGRFINLVHDPIDADINFELNFTGHVHEKWQIKRIRKGFSFTDCVNVGVDVWNFYPVTYEEIINRYRIWSKENDPR